MSENSMIISCGKYGNHKLCYNPNNCMPIVQKLKKKWYLYWEQLCPAYENMLDEQGTEEWGTKEWLSNKEWELHIFDKFTDKDPMPDGRIIFRLNFMINGECNVPIWDVFMDDLEVSHSQPVF